PDRTSKLVSVSATELPKRLLTATSCRIGAWGSGEGIAREPHDGALQALRESRMNELGVHDGASGCSARHQCAEHVNQLPRVNPNDERAQHALRFRIQHDLDHARGFVSFDR